MSSLINIGQSGASVARSALEVTAQNIVNADTVGYVKRGISQTELAAAGRVGGYDGVAFNGVRTGNIARADVPLLQAEARRSGSSAAQVAVETSALASAESTLEQSGFYDAVVEFEASFAQLQSDPPNSSLRTNALEQGRALAGTLNLAAEGLSSAAEFTRFEASSTVSDINQQASDLADVNAALVRSETGTASHAVLLDQRDLYLAQMSQEIGITTEFDASGAVNVRLGDANGPSLVTGNNTAQLTSTENGDGTLSFAVGGASAVPVSGSLAGQSNALVHQRDLLAKLDGVAASTISTLNSAQSNGTAPDGTAGQPFFSGTGASDIGIALASGAGITTAPSGAAINSLDTSNLTALRSALSNGGPASQADSLLFDLSATVRSRSITSEALSTIAEAAEASLAGITEVDLDEEAANLIRYQQAFQASSRVIQVANDIFDSILGIR